LSWTHEFSAMAQGKLKVKAKVPDKKKNKNPKGGKGGSVTKGPHGGGVKKAKSKKELTLQKFKKQVRKDINSHIEAQVSAKATKVEDRKFSCAELNTASKGGKK